MLKIVKRSGTQMLIRHIRDMETGDVFEGNQGLWMCRGLGGFVNLSHPFDSAKDANYFDPDTTYRIYSMAEITIVQRMET